MTWLLEAQNLTQHFPIFSGLFRKHVANVYAVNSVDFTIAPGEALGIVGESGCGKSTIARLVVRLLTPTSGKLYFQNAPLAETSSAEDKTLRRKIQIIFQDPFASLNPRKTIAESLGEPLAFHSIGSNAKTRLELIVEVLEQVGLAPDALYQYPHEFSGGQQQRICIGRALLLSPELLVCDECVSALDVSIQAQILNLLQDLRKAKGLSYLFISHNLSVVRHLCDRVLILYMGKVMEQGPVEAVFSNPKHPYTEALLSAIPKAFPWEKKERMRLVGDLPSPLTPPVGCPFRTRCPYARAECAKPPPKKQASPSHEFWCVLDR